MPDTEKTLSEVMAIGNQGPPEKTNNQKRPKLNKDAVVKQKSVKDPKKPLSGMEHEIKIPTLEELEELRRQHF